MEQTFTITGMSCGHCENAVTTEVGDIAGISDIKVSAATGILTLNNDGSATDEQIIAAIDEAGFSAQRA